MNITGFKAINWSPNEIIGESKMDATNDNANYLFRATPRALYTLPGIARAEGVRVCSGRALIAARTSDSAAVTVRFSNYFSSGCEPNITTGLVSEGQVRIFCVINGIGRLIPDDTGFQIVVNVASTAKKTDRIAKSMYVTWQAVGY